MATAAEKTLATPELLEAVLLALPPLDIFVAQGVNKIFNHAVRVSTKIQRKLFYKRPSSDSPDMVKFNPLLRRFLQHYSIESNLFMHDPLGGVAICTLDNIIDNEEYKPDAGVFVCVQFLYTSSSFIPPPSWDGSYAKMLISDTPIDIMVGSELRGSHKVGVANGGDILTMGDVLEAFWRRSSLRCPT